MCEKRKAKYRIKLLCITLLSCFLLLLVSCADSPATTDSTPDTSADPFVIPMDRVPDSYFNVDTDTLTLVGEDKYDPTAVLYVDENGTEFEFDKTTGAYRGFFPPVHAIEQDDTLSMDAIEKAADELAARFVDTDDYERSYFHQEDTRVHKFTYCKSINGYPTTDVGIVWICADGTIELISFINTGIFDDIELPTIDEQSLDTKFYQAIGDRICEEIEKRTLSVENGVLCLRYDYVYHGAHSEEYPTLDMISIPIE